MCTRSSRWLGAARVPYGCGTTRCLEVVRRLRSGFGYPSARADGSDASSLRAYVASWIRASVRIRSLPLGALMARSMTVAVLNIRSLPLAALPILASDLYPVAAAPGSETTRYRREGTRGS